MSMSRKNERSLLSHDDNETVQASHHPEVRALDAAALEALRDRLRQLRDKERDLARQRRREGRGKEGRGKAESRGDRFAGTADLPLHRKQIFAAALKRANREWARMQRLARRAADRDRTMHASVHIQEGGS